MTFAICVYCGSEKFGAFTTCRHCAKSPATRSEVARSLILTDHYYTIAELHKFGEQIHSGCVPAIDPVLERSAFEEIDDGMVESLIQQPDPADVESCRKREQNIILALIMMFAAVIGWMLYRFAVG